MLILPVPAPDALKQLKVISEDAIRRMDSIKTIEDYEILLRRLFYRFEYSKEMPFALILKCPTTRLAWQSITVKWFNSSNENYILLLGTYEQLFRMVTDFLGEPYDDAIGDMFYRQMNQLYCELEGISKSANWHRKALANSDIFTLELR